MCCDDVRRSKPTVREAVHALRGVFDDLLDLRPGLSGGCSCIILHMTCFVATNKPTRPCLSPDLRGCPR